MHCLNLKITYECSNRCSFCFSSYLKNSHIDKDSLLKAVAKGRDQGCNEMVISGGEPTLCPDLITEVLSLAEKLGYKKYIVQTNGIGLKKDGALVDFFDRVGSKSELCVSFSIHGHNAQITSILCTSNTTCHIYTNTVVTTKNINSLRDIANLVLPYNPDIVQFSMLHLNEPSKLAVSLKDAAFAIRSLNGVVDLSVLKTEGIPYCMLHGLEQCVGESFWPNRLDLYNKENNYIADFKQLNYGMRKKADFCESCIFHSICTGVWKEHYEEFVALGIHPIC